MIYITEIDFNKLSLPQRYSIVTERGHYIAKRRHRGMEVSLYKLEEFYVEVWQRFMLSEICWIEIAPANYIDKYVDAVDLKKLLS
jgi:hypothetical protein